MQWIQCALAKYNAPCTHKTIYSIRRCSYYLFRCSFCAATIQGRRLFKGGDYSRAATIWGWWLFLWKARRHQQWLDKVHTSETVTDARHYWYSARSLSILLSAVGMTRPTPEADLGGGGHGGHGGPVPPPSGPSMRETKRFTARLAHITTLTQRTSLHMNHCFMSCIHRALKSTAPKFKRQFCGSASNTNAINHFSYMYTPQIL